MPSCTLPTNEGLYGFGIRLSFYINWAAIILADYVFNPSRSVRERAATFLLEVAVFVALAKHSQDRTITAVEAYICSFLVTATLTLHIPSVLWRAACCWRRECDLALYSRWRNWATASRDFLTGLRAVYVVALCGWGFWFWTGGLRSLARNERCSRVGFGFGKVRLDSPGLAGFHIAIYAALLAGAGWNAAAGMYNRCGERERRKKRREWRMRMRR